MTSVQADKVKNSNCFPASGTNTRCKYSVSGTMSNFLYLDSSRENYGDSF